MKQKVWVQSYPISTFLVNPAKKLGLYGLLNLIQDTAWIHATRLGHGYEEMLREKTAWILTRQKLQMSRWPSWTDEIQLKTWISGNLGPVAVRDFEIFFNDERAGQCSTQWLVLDLESRKPSQRIIDLRDEVPETKPSSLEAVKILPRKDLAELASFEVRNSDMDLNGHVNNTSYARWILDSIPLEKHAHFHLCGYEVNFIAETKSHDVISVFAGPVENDRFQFQGVRKSDQKIVFTAVISVSAQRLPPTSILF